MAPGTCWPLVIFHSSYVLVLSTNRVNIKFQPNTATSKMAPFKYPWALAWAEQDAREKLLAVQRPRTVHNDADPKRFSRVIKLLKLFSSHLWLVINVSSIPHPHGRMHPLWPPPQWTQNICITFVQRWTNVEDVGSTMYKCYTNVSRLLGQWISWISAPSKLITSRGNARFANILSQQIHFEKYSRLSAKL